MNRRLFITTVGVGSFSLAGCLSASGGSLTNTGSNSTRPTQIDDWNSETRVQVEPGIGDEPEIIVDRDADAVTIEGVASHNSSCGHINVRSPSYDAEESILTVRVTDRKDVPEGEDETMCGDSLSGTSYRISITFDDGVPARIEATETNFGLEAIVETN